MAQQTILRGSVADDGTGTNLRAAALMINDNFTELYAILAGQLPFPATQNASANANTLDDYEEGTFTPSLLIGGINTGITYNSGQTTGNYTKIGNRVIAVGRVTLTSKGGLTGDVTMTGFPMNGSNTPACPIFTGICFGQSSLTGNIVGQMATSSAVLYMNGAANAAVLDAANITNGFDMPFGLTYRTT